MLKIRPAHSRLLAAISVAAGLLLATLQVTWAQDDGRVDSETASAHVQTLADAALGILRDNSVPLAEREETFRQLLRDGFNLEAIGNLVLARHREMATPTQMEEYHRLFGDFVLARYSMLLGGYSGEDFVILEAQDSGRRDVLVVSRIDRPGGDAISTAWRVRAYDGEPKIIDVAVENISMVIAQREEFGAVIDRGGMEALLESLRTQLELLSVEAPS